MTAAVERRRPPALMVKIANPLLARMLSRSNPPRGITEHLMLLHYTGRRSGKEYRVVVGYHRDPEGRMFVLTSSPWRHNFAGGADVEVTLRGERRRAKATLVSDPDEVARTYEQLISQVGVENAGRRLGIAINLDRAPTHAEMVEAVNREGLSRVDIELAD